MQPPPPKQAIARAKARSRRQRVYQEPQQTVSLASEIAKACLSALFIAGLIFSTTALLTLAAVSIRCLIALW